VGAVFLFVALYFGRFLELVPVDTDTIIETLSDAVVVVNDDDQIINANPRAAAVFADGTVDSIIGEELGSVEPTLAVRDRGGTAVDVGSVEDGFEVSRVSGGELQWFWVRTEGLGGTTGRSGSVFTVTEVSRKKRFERRLRQLLRTNQQLVTADTPEQVVSVGVDAARGVLDHPVTGIWRYDEDANRLDPVCVTEEGAELVGEQPSFEPGGSLAWEAFEAGELRSYEDLSEQPGRYNEQTPIRSEIHVPIGEWGLLTTGSTEPGDYLDVDPYLLQLLGEGIQSALRKTRREQRIRKLQERTSSLIDTSSETAIAEEAVETAEEVLGLPMTGLYLLEEDEDVLVPVAVTEAVDDQFGSSPAYPRDNDDGAAAVVWEVFDRGVPLVTGDASVVDGRLADRPVETAIVYPLADHGVLVSSSPDPDAFEPIDRALAELLATAVTAALERSEREEQLRERERELSRQNERLEQFTSAVSHDLRSPLNRADLYLDLLAERYDDSELEAVVEANERAQGMVENLLRLARQGKTVETREPRLVSETASMAWESVRTGSTSLSITDGVGTVEADHARLREVFENLFRNAVEHGGESVRVGRLDERSGLFVADDGAGIPPDERDEVFEHGYSTAEDGTGFGLAIVERIVEAHGWRIAVTESRDGGARFEIEDVSSLSTPKRPADD
jgi:signal transduction histidine kinase